MYKTHPQNFGENSEKPTGPIYYMYPQSLVFPEFIVHKKYSKFSDTHQSVQKHPTYSYIKFMNLTQ